MTNNTTAPALTDEQRAAINMAISVLTPLAMDEYGDALRALLTSPRAAGLPEGWKVSRIDEETISIMSPNGREAEVYSSDHYTVASCDVPIIYDFISAMLDAAPAAPAAEPVRMMSIRDFGPVPMGEGQHATSTIQQALDCALRDWPVPEIRAQAVAADGASTDDLLQLDVLLAAFREAVWEAGSNAWPAYDIAGKDEAKAIQRHVRAMLSRVRAAVSPATAEPREAGHGIKGIPRAAFGPHTEADRIDHCGSCGAENEPQKDDVCPVCHAECSLVSTWGEFQHTRYRNGQRYANNGPQPWEDGPQPATAEPTDYAAIEREHFGDPDKRTGIYAPATADERHEDGLLTTEALISIIERHFDHDHPDGQRLVEMAQDVAASQHKQGEPATADELAAFLVWWTRDVPEELRRDWINRNEQFLREGKACEALARAWEGWQARASQAAAPAEAIDRYQAVCAAAYQLAGVVGAPLRFLDALSDAANGEPMSADEALNLLPVGLNEIDEVNRSASAPADAREPVAQWQTRVRAAKTAAWVNVTEEDAKHVMSELPEAYEVRALYERPEPADAGEAVSSFIRDVAAQKPVLGSSCGLCDSNRNRAQDLLKAAQGAQGGKGGEA
ncbi:hypothetical protein ACVCIH_17885 [Burkholderia glumae]|uniref:hypothetical protein n=1 Tax=Burkholderia glumae TaxID=337 RepID=UPI0020367405|nr:hypothetical protein [Burkholderia glumae]MCM2493266.1 hypothetical protein [Burkholderia glumae]